MTPSRRDILIGTAAAPLLWAAPSLAGRQAERTLALSPRAFVIDGEPQWLTFGAIDYFRIPREEWRETLLRAKRAGLSGIAFYVAWNVHEREDGVFTFTGDADLGHFLDLIHDLGLYAFPRVGPFICAEWEGGGHPAWLITKPDIALRTDHAPTLAYVSRWFAQLVPIIAARQVTAGGPVVMVQQENEYFFVGRPHVQSYQSKLVAMLRALGITVPITDCNGARADTRVAGSMATLNGGGADNVATLRRIQPDRPALISELYTDYITMWGWPSNSYPTAGHLRDEVMATFAAGGMWSYFMFAGGTNFGFWASTSWKSDQSFVTTRYYSRAPIHEGGALSPTYWVAKSANLIAQNLSRFLTRSTDAEPPVAFGGPVRARAVRGPDGYLIHVLPEYPQRTEAIFHTDASGGPLIQLGEAFPQPATAAAAGTITIGAEEIGLAEPSEAGAVLPYRLTVDPGLVIDHANATLLGFAGRPGARIIVLRGAAGRGGVLSLNGRVTRFTVPDDAPLLIPAGDATIAALSSELAERCWWADGRVLIGPAFVGERRGDGHVCAVDGRTDAIVAIEADGRVRRTAVNVAPATEARIALDGWTGCGLAEPASPDDGWVAMARPRSMEHFGCYQGYGWYRAVVDSAGDRATTLYPLAARDRLHVFVNGERQGIWGSGQGATRDPLPVGLRAGRNSLVILVDNMGRRSEGAEQDPKGIFGPVHVDASTGVLPAPNWQRADDMPSPSWRAQTYRHFLPDAPLYRSAFPLDIRPGEGVTLSLRWLPNYVWILLDGAIVAEHPGDLALADGAAFSNTPLHDKAAAGAHRLELVAIGAPPVDLADHARLVRYPLARVATDWAFRAWRDPDGQAPARPGAPTWWRTRFARPAAHGPWFLRTEGLSKGHAYLNGHALGRYWEIGPQHELYVPEAWMAETNQLCLLDEGGERPDHVRLIRDIRVPTQTIVL
jgi:hypothetical protein